MTRVKSRHSADAGGCARSSSHRWAIPPEAGGRPQLDLHRRQEIVGSRRDIRTGWGPFASCGDGTESLAVGVFQLLWTHRLRVPSVRLRAGPARCGRGAASRGSARRTEPRARTSVAVVVTSAVCHSGTNARRAVPCPEGMALPRGARGSRPDPRHRRVPRARPARMLTRGCAPGLNRSSAFGIDIAQVGRGGGDAVVAAAGGAGARNSARPLGSCQRLMCEARRPPAPPD